jgi:hypothetical protein
VVALVALALALLLLASLGAIRLRAALRLRDQRGRWQVLAEMLEGELIVHEDGALSIARRTPSLSWEVREQIPGVTGPALEVAFDVADRLTPAHVFRDPPEGTGPLERVGSEEFRTVFEVDEGALDAGCVRWLADREIQDLLLAMRPREAAVVRTRDGVPRTEVRVVFDEVDLDGLRLAIEWAERLARLAREGIAAAPPH